MTASEILELLKGVETAKVSVTPVHDGRVRVELGFGEHFTVLEIEPGRFDAADPRAKHEPNMLAAEVEGLFACAASSFFRRKREGT